MSEPITHYYSISRSIAYFLGGALLLVVSVLLSVSGSLWGLLGLAMAAAAVWLGVRGVADRKKYPMVLTDDYIGFYKRKAEIRIPVKDIACAFYNTSGVDKRASLRTTSGSVVDLPVLYGLNDLVRRVNKRYRLPGG